MKLGFLGVNYKHANLAIRDRISFTDNKKIDFLQQLEAISIDQCMILSTCNRSEVYFFYLEEEQVLQIRQIYEAMFEEVKVSQYLEYLSGEEAIAYLFRIAAGLESLVLGEDQILGQVKEALDFARTMGFAKKEMNKVVRDAITCAKKIKTQLKISENPLSVSYIGIQRLEEIEGIQGKKVLVIGSGKTATLALTYLKQYQAEKIIVCNRTFSHADRLREEFAELEIIRYEDRYQAIEFCDIVISATASPHLVIRKEELISKKTLTFLDLAAPRDIDIKIEELPGMCLINLDTIQKIVAKNQKEREKLVASSQKIIAEDLKETMDWLFRSKMDATIESLQERCKEIVEDSYHYLNQKMELNKREQKLLQKVLNASLQRLIKEPIQKLKQLDTQEKQEEYQNMVKHLFQNRNGD